ncbi:hypothetical protein [Nonomuraea turkmeniaca]|uniref:hypothetical protein n=1 Tax=Nonomuraea turkmeniaca TaxID=103838 RepID=UPI001B8707E3|nr:hypothetical protein [Nonomuraea turkmeniaca]
MTRAFSLVAITFRPYPALAGQGVNLVQQQPCQFGVMVVEAAGQRLHQRGVSLPASGRARARPVATPYVGGLLALSPAGRADFDASARPSTTPTARRPG